MKMKKNFTWLFTMAWHFLNSLRISRAFIIIINLMTFTKVLAPKQFFKLKIEIKSMWRNAAALGIDRKHVARFTYQLPLQLSQFHLIWKFSYHF